MTMETLIMIPGLGSDAAVWRRTIAVLGNDIDCVVGDTLSDTTLPGMARRILDQAPERFALAGVSMGGMVALELMKIAPERVTRLALIDTNARPDTVARKISRYLTNIVVGMKADFKPLVERSLASLVHPATPDDIRAELVEMSLRVGPKTYIRQNRAVSARGELCSVLPGIGVPTAVIVGREDMMTPVALSEQMHRLIAGSTLHIIPDCGHLPPIEKPEATAALLRGLMRESRRR